MSKINFKPEGLHDKLFLKAFWDDGLGDFVYRLMRSHNLNGHWDELLASGDKEWAERTSEHYGLNILSGSPQGELDKKKGQK